MARSKSAVLKGGTSRAVKRATKLKELKAELASLEKQILKLAKQADKVDAQIEKLETPKVVAVEDKDTVVTDGGGGVVDTTPPAVEAQDRPLAA